MGCFIDVRPLKKVGLPITLGKSGKKNGLSSQKGIKKGVPLYSNRVNLKSNTMKNTLQRYDTFCKSATFYQIKITIYRFI